jgi:hypothetical protein
MIDRILFTVHDGVVECEWVGDTGRIAVTNALLALGSFFDRFPWALREMGPYNEEATLFERCGEPETKMVDGVTYRAKE